MKNLSVGLEVDPADISMLWVRKSTIFCAMGDYETAKQCALHAIEVSETPMGLFRLACASYCQKNYDQALEVLILANKLESENRYVQHAIGVVLARMRSRKDRPTIKGDEDDPFFSS
jgi:tetratricopeptide (TPR) repeat protein